MEIETVRVCFFKSVYVSVCVSASLQSTLSASVMLLAIPFSLVQEFPELFNESEGERLASAA